MLDDSNKASLVNTDLQLVDTLFDSTIVSIPGNEQNTLNSLVVSKKIG